MALFFAYRDEVFRFKADADDPGRSRWRDILDFAREVGLEPDNKQLDVLGVASRRVIVNCTRQWGKSTMVALRVAYEVITVPGSLALVVCPSERQASEFLKKVEQFLRMAGVRWRQDRGTRIGLGLGNGSRVLGVASVEDTIRCFAANMVILDEAAKIPDAVYEAVLPMVAATRGSLWLLSTPFGPKGFFWDEWMRGKKWIRFAVKATECPRISGEFLEEMREKRGEDYFRQEYMCEFVSSSRQLFDRENLDALIALDQCAIRNDWGERTKGREFVLGVDLGKLADFSAVVVVERMKEKSGFDPYWRQETYRWRNVVRHLERVPLGTSYPRVVERVRELVQSASLVGQVTVVVDSTGVGEPVVDAMRQAGMDCTLVPVSITGGEEVSRSGGRWLVPKKEVVVGLQGLVVRQELELAADVPLRDEFVEEMVGMGRNLRAMGGGHDDLVMAVGLAGWRLRSRKVVGEKDERLL